MKSCRKWLAGFLALTLAGLVAAGALVIWVDPFFQYHKPLSWFPYLVDNQVNQNPGLAKHMDYEGVLLGSSMTASFNTDWFGETLGIKTRSCLTTDPIRRICPTLWSWCFRPKGTA